MNNLTSPRLVLTATHGAHGIHSLKLCLPGVSNGYLVQLIDGGSRDLLMCVFAQFYSLVAKFKLLFSLSVFYLIGNCKINLYVSEICLFSVDSLSF